MTNTSDTCTLRGKESYHRRMDIIRPDEEGMRRALAILRSGGVLAHATETCYGLACNLANPDAVMKLFAIKRRPVTQPVSALFPTIEEAKKYVLWNDRAEELARQYLPGPLTLILPLRPDATRHLYPVPPPACPEPSRRAEEGARRAGGGTTLGIRISSHPVARQLAEQFGSPISTTSANVHSLPNPYDIATIQAQFADSEQPDLILDSGTLPPTPPSTVIDLASGKIHRAGNISVQNP